MKILFVTAHPYLPEMLGGSQRSGNALMTGLKRRGHEVALLSSLIGKGLFGLMARIRLKLGAKPYVCDTAQGHLVYRTWFPWEHLEEVSRDFDPDLIVVLAQKQVQMGLAAQKTGRPVFMMLQDAECKKEGGYDFASLGNVPCIANSSFTAKFYRENFNVDPGVVHPIINADLYRVTKRTQDFVTFINPHPNKGLETALETAALCPDIPFLFVEGWPLDKEEKQALLQRLEKIPNIRFLPSQQDIRSVYAQTKILFAPSRWQEAFGRVAAEAQVNGIPVVASDRGGLPEAVGPGGFLLLAEAPAEDWAEKIRELWTDQTLYDDLSAKALAHAARKEMDPDWQTAQWEKAFGFVLEESK